MEVNPALDSFKSWRMPARGVFLKNLMASSFFMIDLLRYMWQHVNTNQEYSNGIYISPSLWKVFAWLIFWSNILRCIKVEIALNVIVGMDR